MSSIPLPLAEAPADSLPAAVSTSTRAISLLGSAGPPSAFPLVLAAASAEGAAPAAPRPGSRPEGEDPLITAVAALLALLPETWPPAVAASPRPSGPGSAPSLSEAVAGTLSPPAPIPVPPQRGNQESLSSQPLPSLPAEAAGKEEGKPGSEPLPRAPRATVEAPRASGMKEVAVRPTAPPSNLSANVPYSPPRALQGEAPNPFALPAISASSLQPDASSPGGPTPLFALQGRGLDQRRTPEESPDSPPESAPRPSQRGENSSGLGGELRGQAPLRATQAGDAGAGIPWALHDATGVPAGSPASVLAATGTVLGPASPDRLAPSTVAESVRSPELVAQVFDHIRLQLSAERPQMTILLNPPELGRLHVKLGLLAGEVHARITAENPRVAQSIEADIASLHRALSEAGLTVARVDVRPADSAPLTPVPQHLPSETGGQGFRQESHQAPPEREPRQAGPGTGFPTSTPRPDPSSIRTRTRNVDLMV